MSSFFKRPVGVHRDMNELEFLAAILQTNAGDIRTNGTIQAADICLYLRSRHGIAVSEADVERLLVHELAGQMQETIVAPTIEDEEDVNKDKKMEEDQVIGAVDICQMIALLLIPELMQSPESLPEFENGLLGPFKKALQAELDKNGNVHSLTMEGLRNVCDSAAIYNASDELLHDMVLVAQNSETLEDVLTGDVQLYSDFKNRAYSKYAAAPVSGKDSSNPTTASVTMIRTVPFLDTIADTFRRPSHVVFIWAAGIFAYFAYMLNIADGKIVQAKCDGEDSTKCAISEGLAAWVSLFLQLMIVGFPFLSFGSIGNCEYRSGVLQTLPAMVMVFLRYCSLWSFHFSR